MFPTLNEIVEQGFDLVNTLLRLTNLCLQSVISLKEAVFSAAFFLRGGESAEGKLSEHYREAVDRRHEFV